MDIFLDVSKRCVLSAAKRAYDQSVNQALRGSQVDPELEARIELLQTALEDMDLAELRGQYSELAGGSDADVRLHQDAQGRISLLLQGKEVLAIHT